MSSLITSLRSIFGPPDPRSEPEINRDLEDEFAFHIDMLEQELIDAGMPRERAAELARARFGNVDRLRTQCRRIALEDRHMMQKINFVLMVIVMLAVVGVSIQMLVTQRYNSLALQDITTQIAKMRIDARLEAREWAGVSDSTESRQPHVTIEGDIENPGFYPIKEGQTLLTDLLQQAGVQPGMYVRYQRASEDRPVTSGEVLHFLESASGRVVLSNDDRIFVYESIPGDSTRVNLGGAWREVDVNGNALEDGAWMELIDALDIRNTKNMSHGSLHLPRRDTPLEVSFANRPRMTSPQELYIRKDSSGERLEGRWTFDDEVLLLNITPAVPAITEPLRFKRVYETNDNAIPDSRPGE